MLLLVSALAAASEVEAQPGGETADAAARAIETLRGATTRPLELKRSTHAGVSTFLRTRRGDAIPSGEAATAPAERRARAFLQRHGAAVGVPERAELSTLRSTGPDLVGMEQVRLQQMHRGLRVRGAELVVHLEGAGVRAVHGRTLYDPIGVDTAASLDATTALARADSFLAGAYAGVRFQHSEPELELFNAGLLDGRPAPSQLAWYIEARAKTRRFSIWIDAQRGDVLLHFNSLPDALNRQIHDAMDTDNVPGALVRSEGQAATGDPDVDEIYDYTEDTYDYFANEHGRDSYDGLGAPMQASVHYCSNSPSCVVVCPCSNAFWFGSFAVFGLLKSDDIVGHEFTHGVVDHSAGLIYLNQSGALNESFADLFGESIDLGNAAGLDTPEVRWWIAEDLIPNSGIRNMADPTLGFLDPDPGKMTDPQLACSTDDNGGVHTNSGIGNHAYALMVDGGSYNGTHVSGIGLVKAGAVEYRALTSYLVATSTYQDHYQALQQSCSDLVGTSGISAADCVQVEKAARAVEMHLPWLCNCGDGSLDSGEVCDDGNNLPGDGCSPVCLIETEQVPSAGLHGWLLLTAAMGALGSLAVRRRSLRKH